MYRGTCISGFLGQGSMSTDSLMNVMGFYWKLDLEVEKLLLLLLEVESLGLHN